VIEHVTGDTYRK